MSESVMELYHAPSELTRRCWFQHHNTSGRASGILRLSLLDRDTLGRWDCRKEGKDLDWSYPRQKASLRGLAYHSHHGKR